MGFIGLVSNTPPDQGGHIFAEEHAAMYQAIYGTGNLIFNYGKNFEVTITGANKISIGSGMLSMQGHVGMIRVNDTQEMVTESGKSGVTRTDLLVMEYESTGFHALDKFGFKILTGSTDIISGNLENGDQKTQMAIALLTIEGLALSKVNMLVQPMPSLIDVFNALNNKVRFGTEEPSNDFGKPGDIYIKVSK